MPVGSRHLLIVGCSGRARGARRAGAADLALSRLAARRGRDDNERYFGPQRWPVFVTVANAPAEPPRTLFSIGRARASDLAARIAISSRMSSDSRDRRRPAPTNSVRRLIVIGERIAEAGVPERDAARRCEAGGARPPSPAPPRALRTKSRGEGRGSAGREARTRSSATLAAAPSPVPASQRSAASTSRFT